MISQIYREHILDHHRYPRNAGELATFTHSHTEHNPLCGDKLRLDLFVNDEEVIDQVAFSGQGCAISIASASMLTELIKGKTLAEAQQIGKNDVLELLGIPIGPVRVKCALLSLKVLKTNLYGLNEFAWEVDEM